MRTMLGWSRRGGIRRPGVFLVVMALTAVLAGCPGGGPIPPGPDPGPSDDLEIRTWYDLDAVRDNLAGHHRLMNDLDATTDGYAELAGPTANGGRGWQPLGYLGNASVYSDSLEDSHVLMDDLGFSTAGHAELAGPTANGGTGRQVIAAAPPPPHPSREFTGTFDGQGYEIRALFVGRPDQSKVGLFSLVGTEGVIDDIRLVNADVTGAYHVGGLVGENRGTVSNSYAAGKVTGTRRVGGLVGGSGGTVSNSYFSGSVAGTSSVGGLVGENEGTVSNSHYRYEEVLINGENMITVGALFADDFEQWLANDKFLDVDQRLAQEGGHYLIHGVDDFKQLLLFGQDGSLRFKLVDDLDLADEPNFYIPYMAGEFDGNGHRISNLALDFDVVSHVGLFGYLDAGGRVTQVGLENAAITGDAYVGGLVARNRGTVSHSYSSGSVTGSSRVGGLVAVNEGTVRNSYSSSCSSSNVIDQGSVGGLVGENWGTLSNCHSAGSVTDGEVVGGLVGQNRGTVSDSYAAGNVTGFIAGGLVGINWSGVSDSHASGSVIGVAWVGGLVGQDYHGTVHSSYATGSVDGESYVGGLVGQGDNSAVSSSYATGRVIGELAVGGLMGRSDVSTVRNCYSTGMVTGDEAVGGLLGYVFRGALSTSYSVSSVTGNEHVGGLVGRNNDGAVSECFWDIETSGQTTSQGGTGKITAEMMNVATYTDTATVGLDEPWDMIAIALGETDPAYIWNIVDGQTYPFLSRQSVQEGI